MISKRIVSREYIKDIPNWEKTYLKDMRDKLSKRQIELLEGADLKSHEGMLYGSMYANWKRRVMNEQD